MARTNRRAITRIVSHALADSERGTAQRLAEAAGVGASTITKWRKGETIPTPEVWDTVEETLELEPGAIAEAAMSPITDEDLDPTPAEVERLRREVDRLTAAVEALKAARTVEELLMADPDLDETDAGRLVMQYRAFTGRLTP